MFLLSKLQHMLTNNIFICASILTSERKTTNIQRRSVCTAAKRTGLLPKSMLLKVIDSEKDIFITERLTVKEA